VAPVNRGLDIWVIVVLAVVAGQLLKLLLFSVTQRELRLGVLGQSAGPPSAQAVCGGSLICACLVRCGWSSLETGVAVVFGAITVFDAMRVRSAAAQQRRVLHELVSIGNEPTRWRRRAAEYLDVLTHTPAHVAVGLFWGFLFALAATTV
jgi:acid phosphatase family membrane protein YuiD